MSLARDLIARWFPDSIAELRIGGVPVTTLAAQHGTPLFVYDAGILEAAWSRLRRAVPSPFEICYSAKANPSLAILRFFVARAWGLEIASAGEYRLARAAGCRPERILFAGPGKTAAELEHVIVQGIGEIHAESPLEIRRIGEIASRAGRTVPVALRINPAEDAQGGAMHMGGKPVPFGIDEEALDEALDAARREPAIAVRGIHVFAGTQILDLAALESQYRAGLRIARAATRRLGGPLATLDFGGGLGIPYFEGDAPLDVAALARMLAAIAAEAAGDPAFAGTRFVIEPGRFLTGEAGVYVARVVDVKRSRGRTFVVLDGGMNHHLAASGNLGQTIKRNFPIVLANRLSEPVAGPADVAGPLCTPLDTLGRQVPLPQAEPGDLVAILQSGAYARSASPLHFLSHPAPAEVWVENGADRLIRRRGQNDEGVLDPVSQATA